MLEPRAVAGRHGDGGVRIEAVEVRMQARRRREREPGGEPAEHGGALDLRVGRTVVEPLVDAVHLLARPPLDADVDGAVAIDELIAAVAGALAG